VIAKRFEKTSNDLLSNLLKTHIPNDKVITRLKNAQFAKSAKI
jgi:hypothetical protein